MIEFIKNNKGKIAAAAIILLYLFFKKDISGFVSVETKGVDSSLVKQDTFHFDSLKIDTGKTTVIK